MATLTIRNLPDDVVKRIKAIAASKGHSMEQEVRQLLEIRYAARQQVTQRIRQRWQNIPQAAPDDISHWRTIGQKRDH